MVKRERKFTKPTWEEIRRWLQTLATVAIAVTGLWAVFATPFGEKIARDLSEQIDRTEREIDRLSEKEQEIVWRNLWVIGNERLARYEFFANISANYQKHREWEDNKADFPPFFWFRIPEGYPGLPVPKILKEDWQWQGANEEVLEIIQRKRDPGQEYERFVETKDFLDQFFMDEVLATQNATKETGRSFIEGLKSNKLVKGLGTDGMEEIEQKLDRFLEENIELIDRQIRVILERDSTDEEKIEEGEKILANIKIFRAKHEEFMEEVMK